MIKTDGLLSLIPLQLRCSIHGISTEVFEKKSTAN